MNAARNSSRFEMPAGNTVGSRSSSTTMNTMFGWR